MKKKGNKPRSRITYPDFEEQTHKIEEQTKPQIDEKNPQNEYQPNPQIDEETQKNKINEDTKVG